MILKGKLSPINFWRNRENRSAVKGKPVKHKGKKIGTVKKVWWECDKYYNETVMVELEIKEFEIDFGFKSDIGIRFLKID